MPILTAFQIDKRLADFKNASEVKDFPDSAWIVCTAVVRTDDGSEPAPGQKVELSAEQGLSLLVVTDADGNLLPTNDGGVTVNPAVVTNQQGLAIFKVASKVQKIYALTTSLADPQQDAERYKLGQSVVYCIFDGSGTAAAPTVFGETDPVEVPAWGMPGDTYAINAQASDSAMRSQYAYATWVGDARANGKLIQLGQWDSSLGALKFRVPFQYMSTEEESVNAVSYLVSALAGTSEMSSRRLFSATGTPVAEPDPELNPTPGLSSAYCPTQQGGILTADNLNQNKQLVIVVPRYARQVALDKITLYIYLNGWVRDTYNVVSTAVTPSSIYTQNANDDTSVPISANLLRKFCADPDGRPGKMYVVYQVNDAWWGAKYAVNIDFSGA
jgi:hypothetical protein